jgi:hypothetical protein
MKPATVAVPVLVRVVTAAGGRCECTGRGCHSTKEARCPHESPAWRLTAAPRDLSGPAFAAWRVPVEQLAAWCSPCLDHGQRLAARARAAAAPMTGDLLDLVDTDPTSDATTLHATGSAA